MQNNSQRNHLRHVKNFHAGWGFEMKQFIRKAGIYLYVRKTDTCYISIEISETALNNLEIFLIYRQIEIADTRISYFRNESEKIIPFSIYGIGLGIADVKIFTQLADA
jgi:hypothetical protein